MIKSRKTLSIIVAAAVAILLISLVLIYFFVWRLPDDRYQSAVNAVSAMQSSSADINKKLASIQSPAAIGDATVTGFATDVDTFNSALKSLGDNTVVSKDQTVKASYAQYGNSLTDYSKTASSLKMSFYQYGSIIGNCAYLVSKLPSIKDTATFDTTATACKQSAEKVTSLSGSSFKTQYLDSYADLVIKLLAVYRTAAPHTTAAQAAADTAAVNGVLQQIGTLAKKQLSLTLDSPTSSLQKLQDTLSTQSKALIR